MAIGNYKILSVLELKNYLKIESRDILDYDIQIPTSLAFTYYLKSGNVILLPNNLLDNSKGLLFESKELYEYYAKNETFPIENEDASLEEFYQEEVLSIDKRTLIMKECLADKFNIVKNNTSLEELLDVSKKNKLKGKDIFYAGALLGDLIRQQHNGQWMLLKMYGTFNSYYTLAITYPDGSVIILKDVLDRYFLDSKMTLSNFLRERYIMTPSMKINTPFFQHAYANRYKILE